MGADRSGAAEIAGELRQRRREGTKGTKFTKLGKIIKNVATGSTNVTYSYQEEKKLFVTFVNFVPS